LSASDRQFLLRLKVVLAIVIVVFLVHGLLLDIRLEVWPGQQLPVCPEIYVTELRAWVENKQYIVPLADLYNHLYDEFEYLLALNIAAEALRGNDLAKTSILNQAARAIGVDEVKQVEIWMERYDLPPSDFVRERFQREPEERILIGTIPISGDITVPEVAKAEGCRPLGGERGFIANVSR
jgi:hypothetical protein